MRLADPSMVEGAVGRRGQGQGSIYRTADGTWHASLRIGRDEAGRALRRHVQAPTRRQAVAKLELLRISCGPVITVADWTATWMALVERTLKYSTAKSYRTHVRYLAPLADLTLSELSVEHIESSTPAWQTGGCRRRRSCRCTAQSGHASVKRYGVA